MLKFSEKIFGWCYKLLMKLDFNETIASYFSLAVNIIILSCIAYVMYMVFRFVLVTIKMAVA